MKLETLLLIAAGVGGFLYLKKRQDAQVKTAALPQAVARQVSPLREEDSELFVDYVPYPVYPYPMWGGTWGGGWGGRGGGGHHHHHRRH